MNQARVNADRTRPDRIDDVCEHEREQVVGIARSLLGRTFTGHGVSIRLTEVEAYGGTSDPASHAFTRTPRSEIMYGQAWRLYVYRSYGIHWCVNIVTGPTAIAGAVLLRAGRVIDGLARARSRRGDVPVNQLARGPGNLGRALGISNADLHSDVRCNESVWLSGAMVDDPVHIAQGPRVGVSRAADVPWRFWIAGDPTVSAYRRSPRATLQ